MKNIAIFIILMLSAALFTGCNGAEKVSPENQTGATVKKITAAEAKAMLDSGESLLLVDVRTEEEYREIRIEGSILIPDYDIENLAESSLPDKDAKILVYCRSGRRSALAAEALVKMGYTNVYDFGGINDWNYETVSD